MPALPPYSSTTTARCAPSRRISASAGRARRLSGSRSTGRARVPTAGRRGSGAVEQVAQVDEADDVVEPAVDDRVAGVRLAAGRRARPRGRSGRPARD